WRLDLVGRHRRQMGDARRARFDWAESRSEPHAVLGQRHRWILSDARTDRRTLPALVSVLGVLPVVPRARTHVEAAPAVGLEHRRVRTEGTSRAATSRCLRAAQPRGGTDLQNISRTALSP